MHRIVDFARDTLGITLYPGQAEALSDYYESGMLNWLLLSGRRGGKSLLSDVIACYEALVPDFEGMVREDEERYILIVSVRQDNAQLHIRNIAKLLRHRKEIGKMITRVAEDRIELTNNVVILSLPASARAARGYTASTLILDEAAFFVDTLGNSSAEAIYTALEPTTATFGDKARIVIATSVAAKTGLVYDLFDRSTQGDLPDYCITKAATTVLNPKVSQKTIDRALQRDQEGAEAEYLCEFREKTEAFLNSEAVDQCTDKTIGIFKKKRKSDSYLMAVDPALMRDSYGYGVAHLEDGIVIIDYIKALHAPVDANGAEDMLQSLVDRYKPTGVLCDNASTVQRLKSKIPVMKYTPFSRQQKLRIYGALKEAVNLQTIILPNDSELIDELKSLQIRNGVDIAAPKSGRVTHDDLADCVALLVDGLVSEEYKVNKVRMVPNIFSWGEYEGLDTQKDFLYYPDGNFVKCIGVNQKPHPEGVTFRNCPYRHRPGCQVCVDEMENDPEIQEQNAREEELVQNRLELTRGTDPEEVERQDKMRFLQEMGILDQLQKEDQDEAQRSNILNTFWKGVNNGRAR